MTGPGNRGAIDLFIGTYSGGVRPLVGRPDGSDWVLGPAVAGTEKASWAVTSRRRLHYLVCEQDDGRIRVFDGTWTLVAEVWSGGALPCFLALNHDETVLGAANYGCGHVAFFHLSPEGLPMEPPLVRGNHGGGPDKDRQDGPHAHCVRYCHGVAYSTDLGTDQILGHTAVETFAPCRLPPGEGPRHIVFHPNLPVAYVLTELGSRLFVLDCGDDGRLTTRTSLSTLPADFSGRSLGGHLALNAPGDRLYLSNRGHDSLVVYEVGKDGTPNPLQTLPSGAASPRHFHLDEAHRRLIVAHQNGNRVKVFAVTDAGTLAPTPHSFEVEQAAFIGAGAA